MKEPTSRSTTADAQPGTKPDAPADPKDELKTLPIAEVGQKLGSSPDGLTEAEATKRLTQDGPNEIAERRHNPLLKLLTYFWGPMLNERLPHPGRDTERLWENRFRSIVQLEKHLYRNGTRIVKVFLHLPYGEQRRRFLDRLGEPDKRAYWPKYVAAHGECLQSTSTHHAPWYVVPADDKDNARLIVSRIVLARRTQDGLPAAEREALARTGGGSRGVVVGAAWPEPRRAARNSA